MFSCVQDPNFCLLAVSGMTSEPGSHVSVRTADWCVSASRPDRQCVDEPLIPFVHRNMSIMGPDSDPLRQSALWGSFTNIMALTAQTAVSSGLMQLPQVLRPVSMMKRGHTGTVYCRKTIMSKRKNNENVKTKS